MDAQLTAAFSTLPKLRRLGRVLGLDGATADAALLEEIALKRWALAASEPERMPKLLYRFAIDAFRRCSTEPAGEPAPHDDRLLLAVRGLPYREREALALLIVEQIEPDDASFIAGRSAEELLRSALRARSIVEGAGAGGDLHEN